MTAYQPLQERAYDHILNMIATGELKPHTIYSETRLSAMIGVSRTPVREALVRLSQDKYIDILPSRGFRLHMMAESDILDTYQIRTAIEGFCALYLRSRRGSPDYVEATASMERSLAQMLLCIRNHDSYEAIMAHDYAFHQTMVQFSGNRDMIELFGSYNHRLTDIAIKSFEAPGRPMSAYREHAEIFSLLNSELPDADGRLYFSVMRHMEAARDIALALIRAEQSAD